MEPMNATVFCLVVLAICLASLYFGLRGVAWLFGELSGWHRLETPFACNADERVWTHRGQTIRVNRVRFRSCVSAGIQADALYLRAMAIFRYRAVRIPWERMSMFQPDSVYGRPAMRFAVGETTIVVESHLYAAMYPHLSRAFSAAPGAGRGLPARTGEAAAPL
jgi:hypothetical protein